MSALKSTLSHLETRLQSLIEGGAARLFPSRLAPHILVDRLLAALRDGLQTGSDGEPVAPNLYILQAHPSQAAALRANPALLEELARTLREAGQEASLHFAGPPVLRVEDASQLAPGDIRVLARNSLDGLAQTSDISISTNDSASDLPLKAFLIVDGMQTFPLTHPVINIGRRPDNHLVIDDPRVSRLHAQLRLVRGHYVIFDLDSTGGTWVNGQRIHQHTLYPGDVITLSGLPLVFGQDGFEPSQTQELSSPS